MIEEGKKPLPKAYYNHEGSEPTLIERVYQYDQIANLITIDDQERGKTYYTYDLADRLLKTQRQPGIEEEFAYDRAGNLTQINETILTYGTGNRLLKQGKIEYIYDDNGRLIKKIENTDPPKIWEYSWDSNDYLSSITTPKGDKWTYKYDALGRRILKQGPDKTVRFIWNGNFIIHILENDKLHATWIHQPRTFKPLCTVQNDQVYSIICDHLGTPQELIDCKGKIIWLAHYQTWGKVESIDTAQKEVDCPIRFPGQWFDDESGLHYNRFRYYDPQTGRFISQDPIGLIGGLNSYWYAKNPVNWVDVLGLCPNYASLEEYFRKGLISENDMLSILERGYLCCLNLEKIPLSSLPPILALYSPFTPMSGLEFYSIKIGNWDREHGAILTRFLGGLQMVAGVVEIGGAALFKVPVVSQALGMRGIDNLQAGGRTFSFGTFTPTLVYDGLYEFSDSLGVDNPGIWATGGEFVFDLGVTVPTAMRLKLGSNNTFSIMDYPGIGGPIGSKTTPQPYTGKVSPYNPPFEYHKSAELAPKMVVGSFSCQAAVCARALVDLEPSYRPRLGDTEPPVTALQVLKGAKINPSNLESGDIKIHFSKQQVEKDNLGRIKTTNSMQEIFAGEGLVLGGPLGGKQHISFTQAPPGTYAIVHRNKIGQPTHTDFAKVLPNEKRYVYNARDNKQVSLDELKQSRYTIHPITRKK